MSAVQKSGPVVAIDGPAGAGKSTLARRLAEDLGLPYLNTGLMYRRLALEALRRGIAPGDGPALADAARSLAFDMDRDARPPVMVIDGRAPDDRLVTAEVERVVSEVSGHREVRAVLRAEQRRLGAAGAVVEGRDIGTVVFPDAELKVFLLADPAERAARRLEERGSEDPALAAALARRDALDARTNPLEPAAQAHVVDTTGHEPEDVFAEVRALALEALGRQDRTTDEVP